jgi:hypothetical protein
MILRIDGYLMTYLLLGIKEWIMEDMWDIKKVLEVQGNMHNMVEVPGQFRVQESDFESSSESRNTLPSNLCTGCVPPLI